ncbi:MAG: hypothetical protein Kow00129_00220 [Thermoleophilia bacterium]
MTRSTKVLLLILVLVFLVLPGSIVTADVLAHQEDIYPGVRLEVNGELAEFGGLSPEEAERALRELDSSLGTRTVTFAAGGDEILTLTYAEAGVRLDVQETLRLLLAPGHEHQWPERATRRLRSRFNGTKVSCVYKTDEAALLRLEDELSLRLEKTAKDATVILTEDGPKAVAAEPGVALNRSLLTELLLESARLGEEYVQTPLETLEPDVTTEEASRAVRLARRAFAAPIELGYQNHRFALTAEQLAQMATVRSSVAGGPPLTFDTESGRKILGDMLAPLEHPATDAELRPRPDGGFEVVPGRDGVVIDWEPLFRELDRVAVMSRGRYVPIPTKTAPPRLSTADAARLGIGRGVASFTTYFSPANESRANNIRQVAQILDGTLIQPGEEFSFNETVGPRTKAAGFDEAPVIVGGVLTPGVGGGICQVSTTLFNAVFLAGLPVTERKPHSFFIEHYPIGRDATVSYGTVDFRFKNDTDRLLYLSVQTGEGFVTVSLGAGSWDRTVEYETLGPTDLVAPRTSAENPRRLRDPTLGPGEVAPVEAGVAGRRVTVKRRVYGPGGELLFEDLFESVYAPKDYVQRVGA